MISPVLGKWNIENNLLSVKTGDSFAVILAGNMPSCCKIEAEAKFEGKTGGFGLMLRASADSENGDYVRL